MLQLGEGNTRTTAVFTIKYLKSLGFDENNELKKRYCHIKYNEQTVNEVTQKVTVNVTVKFTANIEDIEDYLEINFEAKQW